MRVGIPVYVFLFYLPIIFLAVRDLLWGRRVPAKALPAGCDAAKSMKSAVFGFCHRVAYAALISALLWVVFVDIPLRGRILYSNAWISQVVLIWLDLPIATVTQFLPCNEAAVDCWFRVWCPELTWPTRGYFYNHMRLGTPIYVLIFYLPTIYRSARGWWLRWHGHSLRSSRSSTVRAKPVRRP